MSAVISALCCCGSGSACVGSSVVTFLYTLLSFLSLSLQQQDFAPQRTSLSSDRTLFASQEMCPNFLSPKLTYICSHSCSHPPLGLSNGRDFLYPIAGLPGLLSPPTGPFSTQHSLLCTHPCHSHGNTFKLLPHPTFYLLQPLPLSRPPAEPPS